MEYLKVYCPDKLKIEAKQILLEKCGSKCKQLRLNKYDKLKN